MKNLFHKTILKTKAKIYLNPINIYVKFNPQKFCISYNYKGKIQNNKTY